MKRPKSPVKLETSAGYPRKDELPDRRRFFSMLAAGAAGVLLLSGRESSAEGRDAGSGAMAQRFAPPPPPRPDDYYPPPPPPGAPPRPDYFSQRVPAHGSWSVMIDGDYYVSYAIAIKHDHPEIDWYIRTDGDELKEYADKYIRRYLSDGHFHDHEARRKVSRKIDRKLRRILGRRLRDHLVFAKVVIMREKYIHRLDGVVAPPYY